MRVLAETCPPHVWREIVQRAVADAKGGDAGARTWLSKYLLGANPPTLHRLAVEEAAGGDPIQADIDRAAVDAALLEALCGRPRNRSAD